MFFFLPYKQLAASVSCLSVYTNQRRNKFNMALALLFQASDVEISCVIKTVHLVSRYFFPSSYPCDAKLMCNCRYASCFCSLLFTGTAKVFSVRARKKNPV